MENKGLCDRNLQLDQTPSYRGYAAFKLSSLVKDGS